jgi:RNA polymerase sigma-70 factor (ECF subfamily)
MNSVDFPTFMRNYQDMVYATAARLVGSAAQAEDIAQDVFLKAYDRFDMLGASPTAGGWLKTVATNLSLNYLQRYRKRWSFFSELTHPSDDDAKPATVEFPSGENFFSELEGNERRIWVEQCLDQLPDHQRVPLVLFHFEDMPYDEIARKLGVSLAKIKTDILRARAALAALLIRPRASHETFEH